MSAWFHADAVRDVAARVTILELEQLLDGPSAVTIEEVLPAAANPFARVPGAVTRDHHVPA
ncbi:MAG: hypothetical protein LH645_00950 [Actinomycetia bacterium]|nr:hypothetical protein [Actinomycetes bacterium]